MDKAIIGAILKRRIKEKGYTQESFADAVGIGHSTLKKYINGSIVYNYELLEIFAEKLDCSFDYLLGKSRSAKREYQDISNKLRLSDEAIERIEKFAQLYDTDKNAERFIRTLDIIIRSEGLITCLADYLMSSRYTNQIGDILSGTISKGFLKIAGVSDVIGEEMYPAHFDNLVLIMLINELSKAKHTIGTELLEDIHKTQLVNETKEHMDNWLDSLPQGVIKRND